MTNNRLGVMYSSLKSEWETPQLLFDNLKQRFPFQIDVCADENNKKCEKYFSVEDDGLKQSWYDYDFAWMNPPYGKKIGLWVRKAYEQSLNYVTVVCLLPSRTDTKWWHEYIMKGAAEVWFVKGRIKFSNHKNPAPFPSVIVVFDSNLRDKNNHQIKFRTYEN